MADFAAEVEEKVLNIGGAAVQKSGGEGSTTGSIYHTSLHVIESFIKILEEQLLRNLVVRETGT